MPAATTHVEFARDVFNALPAELQNGIRNMPMYFLGSQGPDFFFFSRFMALPGTLHGYGNLMHDEKVAETMSFMDAYTEGKADLRSYFLGFLTHYALDSTAHPLICAFAAKEHETLGTHEGEAHFREEGEIDVWILKRKGRSPSQYNVFSDLRITKQDAEALADMYHALFLEVYGTDIPMSRIKETAYEVWLITKLLKPSRLKHALIRNGESLLKLPHMISGMMLQDKDTDPAVLNRKHEAWTVPGYGGLRDTRSFEELYEEALYKAERLLEKRSPEDFTKNFVGLPL